MKSERLTLLVAPREKRTITASAKRAGVTASEYVRRAVAAYEGEKPAEPARADNGPSDLKKLLRQLAEDAGEGSSETDLRRSAFDELMDREDERLDALRAYLEEGRAAIARGEGIVLKDAAAIDRFFNDRKRAR
ncbi:MAG: hypothetical protein ABL957_03670 [Parvularculaceae bacterium]